MNNGIAACLYCRTAQHDENALELQKRKLLFYAEESGYEAII